METGKLPSPGWKCLPSEHKLQVNAERSADVFTEVVINEQ